MEKSIDREFRGMWLKTMKKLFNYDQKTNPFVFFRDEKRNLRFPCIQWKREQNFVFRPWFFSWFADFRGQSYFPYKIAVKISKIAICIQTKNKFDDNSTWRSLKYQNKQMSP
jgi:hypothetical protein